MPGSTAETKYGRRGGGYLPKSKTLTPVEGVLFGTAGRCATCGQDRPCVAIASDPRHPESGRWFVCSGCRSGWSQTGPGERQGLVYEPIEEAVAS